MDVNDDDDDDDVMMMVIKYCIRCTYWLDM